VLKAGLSALIWPNQAAVKYCDANAEKEEKPEANA
jgi:hypothetical protein